MSKIVICPVNTDATPLQLVVIELRREFPDLEIKAVELKRADFGPITNTILVFVGKEVIKKAISKALDRLIEWAKQRIEDEGDFKRPKYITIFGHDGIPIVSKTVLPSGEVEDRTNEVGPTRLPIHLL